MIKINTYPMFAVDFFVFLDFFLETIILILLLLLIVLIGASMKKNQVFKDGAGPWVFMATIFLSIPVFFDVLHDLTQIFTSTSLVNEIDDLLKNVDLLFFIIGAILGVYGYYRQYLHSESLNTLLKLQINH